MSDPMRQMAPYPTELADLVASTALWPGWHVWLSDNEVRDPASTHGGEGRGMTLTIQTKTYNTYDYEAGQDYRVRHIFIVPAATYNRRSWQRWLFEQFAKVQLHEAMEAFVVDGERPFAPHHGPGNDPYTVFEHGDDVDVRTSFRGEVNA
jgi:hypothetical protein